jgi:Flp pilus assembly protein TadD
MGVLNALTQISSAILNKVQSGQLFDQAKALYDAGDFKAALPLMKESAEKGSPNAMAHLGIMLMKGQGVAADWAMAAKLLKMTIEVENYQGTYFTGPMIKSNLGLIYGIGGYGLKRNLEQARQYLQEAVDEGDLRSEEALRMVIEKRGVFGQKERAKPEIRW